MRVGEPGKLQSNINITPLVDVVLVLLIIFMVVAPNMRQGKGPEIDMPATDTPKEQGVDRPRILVTVDERGGLWIDDQQVTAETLGDGLRAAAGTDPDIKIVIKGDAKLPFGEVRKAMLAIEQAGYHGVGLIAEPASVKTAKG
jgi:biopolymer transport protein TolR